MKTLYLLRHAEAVPSHECARDSLRALTEAGRRQAEEAARTAQKNGASFDRILTSPYLRAAETAEIFADVYGMPGQTIQEPSLACGCSVGAVKKLIVEHRDARAVLCVGHEPDLGIIAGAFLGLHRSRPLEKAELVVIDDIGHL